MTTALSLASLSFAPGCGPPRRVASAAELDHLGTRTYPQKPNVVLQALVTAVELQGYKVVTTKPRLRTAPKPIALHAMGGGGRAVGYDETMAWDIEVSTSPRGSTVHAKLLGEIAGSPMSSMFYDYADDAFRNLYKKVDESLAIPR